jgi:diguanylate cyclase (GGDEF)-like protein
MGVEDAVRVILGRWALGVQTGLVCLLAIFFVALARTVRLAEIRQWAWAWCADLLALTAVFVTAFTSPPLWVSRLALALYAGGKTAYVLLLVAGAQYHLRPGTQQRLHPRQLVLLVAVWSLSLAALAPEFAHVQVAQAFMVGMVLVAGSVWVLRHPKAPRSRWLGWALLAEGALFLHYVPVLLPLLWGGQPLAGYIHLGSFFDAAAELLVGLGILVALESNATEHLRHLNEELVASQDRLRQLADLDPLTNLANRRGLRAELQGVRAGGATLVFIDVRDFKGINDRHGHIAGDACLKRVASTLAQVFRAEDGLFRWGGDEFLVVAPGLDLAGAEQRVAEVRRLLTRQVDDAPACDVSIGIAELSPGGEPEAALREVDALIVADKQKHKLGGERPSGVSRLSGIWQKQA